MMRKISRGDSFSAAVTYVSDVALAVVHDDKRGGQHTHVVTSATLARLRQATVRKPRS